MTFTDPKPGFIGHGIFEVEYLKNNIARAIQQAVDTGQFTDLIATSWMSMSWSPRMETSRLMDNHESHT